MILILLQMPVNANQKKKNNSNIYYKNFIVKRKRSINTSSLGKGQKAMCMKEISDYPVNVTQ